MDKSSINSLNSARNFKLPPIQGVLPATLYEEKTWDNKPSLTNGHRRSQVRIQKDPFITHDFHSLHKATLQSRSEHCPKKTTTVSSSSRQHTTVSINLGHDFPKSYSVLPPINKDSQVQNNETSFVLSANKITPVKRGKRTVDKKYRTASELLSKRRRERFQGEQNKAHSDFDQDGVTINSQANKKIESPTTEETKETNKIVHRKESPTYLLFLKSKRSCRRGGACVENESSLMNVTEQLKEIFLRRNMEEMYLI